jgi:DNA-directed RNA polymerase specialized sigma24 family protein
MPGIDLTDKYEDVRRLLTVSCGATIKNNCWDFDDVFQTVMLRLTVSNRGKCPFDPEKGHFGTYVWRACVQTVRNYWRSEHRHADSLLSDEEGHLLEGIEGRPVPDYGMLMERLMDSLAPELKPWLPYVVEGLSGDDTALLSGSTYKGAARGLRGTKAAVRRALRSR